MKRLLVGTLVLLWPLHGFAGEAVTEPAATTQHATSSSHEGYPVETQGRVVCKREKTTGSFITRKVCRTERQIADEREHSQTTLRTITQEAPMEPGLE